MHFVMVEETPNRYLQHLVALPAELAISQSIWAAAQDVLESSSPRTERTGWCISLLPELEFFRAGIHGLDQDF